MTSETPRRIGVLSLHNSKETKAILNAIEALGHRPVWLRRENVDVTLGGSEPVDLTPDVDVVINRLLLSKATRPSRLLGVAEAYASVRPVLNPPSAAFRALHKVAASAHLDAAELPIPTSAFALDDARLAARREAIAANAGTDGTDAVPEDGQPLVTDGGAAGRSAPVVHKRPIGTHGDGTTKLDPADPIPRTVEGPDGMLQTMVDQPGEGHSDVRVYVVGDRIIAAMRRHASGEDWRTNVARGGRVEDVTGTLPDEARRVARDAARTLGLDCAGVDLIEGREGWAVLEANPTAGFKGLFEATGISPAPYIAQLAVTRAGGLVDPAAVESAAGTLDDSVPACRPDLGPSPSPATDTIGFTEPVQVSGRRGAETVIGKADTGASRTSIDTGLAGRIGAGPIVDTTTVKTGSTKAGTTRPLVEIGLRIGEYTHRVTASIEDRGHMTHELLLGRDVLDAYRVDVSRRHGAGGSATAPTEE